MHYIVFDVAAEYGGALTILKQYHQKALNDIANKWYFVVSIVQLIESSNVKILYYPNIKKSWLNRLWFDIAVAPRLVRIYKADQIFSLQNVVVPFTSKPQTLYLHQPVPFCKKKFSLRENRNLWLYQNIISILIFYSIKKAEKIIVQTQWMKNACLQIIPNSSKKIYVVPPKIDLTNLRGVYNVDMEKKYGITFFYPAGPVKYKNHITIIEAVSQLVEHRVVNFHVLFTFSRDENKYAEYLYDLVANRKLPIDFIGYQDVEHVFDYYIRTTLLFPSYLETFGLPLLEAKLCETPIIASDCAFAREILEGYDKTMFFQYDDVNQLSLLMEKHIRTIAILNNNSNNEQDNE